MADASTLRAFERRLRSTAKKSDKTVQSYLEAARLLAGWLDRTDPMAAVTTEANRKYVPALPDHELRPSCGGRRHRDARVGAVRAPARRLDLKSTSGGTWISANPSTAGRICEADGVRGQHQLVVSRADLENQLRPRSAGG